MECGQKDWSNELKALFHKKHLTHYTTKIPAIKFRENQASILLPKGYGVELGALYWPTPMTEDHYVIYADMRTKEQSQSAYKEKAPPIEHSSGMVDIDIVIDHIDFHIDIPSGLDFLIANHVFEHTIEPTNFLKSIAKCLRIGGIAMLTVPDANKIYDRPRARTNIFDFGSSRHAKIKEYLFFVEGIKTLRESNARFKEIVDNKEDPHLWTFDLSTIQNVLLQAFSYYEIPLKIKTLSYNAAFEEINVFLERI